MRLNGKMYAGATTEHQVSRTVSEEPSLPDTTGDAVDKTSKRSASSTIQVSHRTGHESRRDRAGSPPWGTRFSPWRYGPPPWLWLTRSALATSIGNSESSRALQTTTSQSLSSTIALTLTFPASNIQDSNSPTARLSAADITPSLPFVQQTTQPSQSDISVSRTQSSFLAYIVTTYTPSRLVDSGPLTSKHRVVLQYIHRLNQAGTGQVLGNEHLQVHRRH